MTTPAVADSVQLDAHSLRGLAHPLRLQLLGLLRERGPATATGLAALVGESSGTTSYHLRQLAAHGFIVEDPTPHVSRRERWWRAAHRMTHLDVAQVADPESATIVDEYRRAVAGGAADRIVSTVNDLTTLREQDPAWAAAADFSDWMLELTAEEAHALSEQLTSVVERFRMADPERTSHQGARDVVVQVQVLPSARGPQR